MFIRLSLLAALMQAGATASAAESLEVQGHRGARAAYPENSIPAFLYAAKLGVDVLEMDLVVTKDDQVVVLHDLILDPTICTGPGGGPIKMPKAVRDLTLSELRTYDCTQKEHPRFPNQAKIPPTPIPTLKEVLSALKKVHPERKIPIRHNMELKLVPAHPEWTPSPDRFASMVIEILKEHDALGTTTLQSFDQRVLHAAAAIEPGLPRAILIAENHLDAVSIVRSAKANIYSPHLDWITQPQVEALHDAGVRVVPWTANSPSDWARLVRIGVDGIITDDPAGLLAWIGR